jgi:hypothetical protein
MEIEDQRDQGDRQHQAGDDAPPQFEPHGEQGNFSAEPFALCVAPIKIVRQYRQQRA